MKLDVFEEDASLESLRHSCLHVHLPDAHSCYLPVRTCPIPIAANCPHNRKGILQASSFTGKVKLLPLAFSPISHDAL